MFQVYLSDHLMLFVNSFFDMVQMFLRGSLNFSFRMYGGLYKN